MQFLEIELCGNTTIARPLPHIHMLPQQKKFHLKAQSLYFLSAISDYRTLKLDFGEGLIAQSGWGFNCDYDTRQYAVDDNIIYRIHDNPLSKQLEALEQVPFSDSVLGLLPSKIEIEILLLHYL